MESCRDGVVDVGESLVTEWNDKLKSSLTVKSYISCLLSG